MTRVARKASVGLIQLQAALALMLFASAGTVRWWQAWAYWLVFLAGVLAITLDLLRRDPALLESRTVAGPLAERRPWQKVVQGLASAAFVALHVVPGLDRRHGWTSVAPSVSLLADLAVATGLGLVSWVLRVNRHARSTVSVTEGQRVVTTGPYAVVRHPMYSGALVMLVATPLALGSLAGLPFVLPLAGAMVARIVDEERLLTSDLPGYREYCREVRWRLVPLVW